MAVFTPVSTDDIARFLESFDLGAVRSLEGIASGIENTNYFLDTTGGDPAFGRRFVLTIFEKLRADELPFYLEFMRALSDAHIRVPKPIPDRSGAILFRLQDKPCSIATRLPGQFIEHPNTAHCAQVGAALARMHTAGLDFMRAHPALMQNNPRGLMWWIATEPVVAPHIPPALKQLLHHEVREQSAHTRTADFKALPRGPVHADLFRNNVLFDGDAQTPQLGGFIDFYFGGVDTWLFDIAVTVNDWCIDLSTGELDEARADALLIAYGQVRPFAREERDSWTMALRAAALRFWISRLYDYYLPRDAETLTPHDPAHFERVLRLRRLHEHVLP